MFNNMGTGRRLGHAARDGRRILVVWDGDETIEHVARVEIAGVNSFEESP